jgi:hypothetical protein
VELEVVAAAFRLGFHAAEPHANPTIQAIEALASREEPRRKVLSGTPNDSVEFVHQSGVQVVLAASEFANLVFKFLHRLGPHAPGTAGEDKSQEGVALPIGGYFRFLQAQLKLELLFQNLLHESQCLFGLVCGGTEHHEVIGVTNKPIAGMV